MRYTEDEWKMIEIQLAAKNGDFHAHLNNSMHRLARFIPEGPVDKTLIVRGKLYSVSPEISCKIIKVANVYGLSLAQVVDRFVINPLLNNYVSENGFDVYAGF